MRIDAHLHVWQDPAALEWLTAELAPIHRGFAPAEARAAIAAAGFDRAVLVQAADTDADTEQLLALAEAHDWVAGVVGWVPLDDPARAEQRLDALAGRPLVGVRALIHDQPDDGLLDRPVVRETLRLLAERALPLDVPDAWPAHLAAATRAAAEVDGLIVVLDHLGKPPSSPDELPRWRAALSGLAAVPTALAKVSGLHRAGRALPDDAFDEVWDAALEAFGPERLMLGSDWPMPLLSDGLEPLTAQLERAIGALSPAECRDLEAGTAARAYRLEV
ncbi:amidohydrolase family protein [Agrococcus sp. TF02-05]|uniref:amidohydrolase family protein n=1 Tax=Agrococcus sp. TF02-05 TaxID=2815211 RepID=UPI0027DB600C|nr:amidohydrolase family protein [Agrococcus sp. TF02-05]